jgi:hypothetical protein
MKKRSPIYAAVILLALSWVGFIHYKVSQVAPAVRSVFTQCPRTPQDVGLVAATLADLTGLDAAEHPNLGGINPSLHSATSRHHDGLAVDFNGRWYDTQVLEALAQELKKTNCVTATLEGWVDEHVHMELRLPEPPPPSDEETLVETCTGVACIAGL